MQNRTLRSVYVFGLAVPARERNQRFTIGQVS